MDADQRGPKEARWNGAGAAWKVFTYRGEVADPSPVLVRVKNSGFRSISAADIKRPITFMFPGRAVKEFSMTGYPGMTRRIIAPSGLSGPSDPMCSIFRDPRRDEYTICTAVAPDAVLTVRTYGTRRSYSAWSYGGAIAGGSHGPVVKS
jgi:hypothetical protein